MGRPKYLWRKLTPEKQQRLLDWRKSRGLPWHSIPHLAVPKTRFHLTAACYEHRAWIGRSEERTQDFCLTLLSKLREQDCLVHAWCVLPNHYHVLVTTQHILKVLAHLGKMHAKLAWAWNGEEDIRGRTVW